MSGTLHADGLAFESHSVPSFLTEPMVKRYLYVQAVVVNALVGNPGAITFRSTEVSADNEDSAYVLGQEWATYFTYRPAFETVNDFVREVGV